MNQEEEDLTSGFVCVCACFQEKDGLLGRFVLPQLFAFEGPEASPAHGHGHGHGHGHVSSYMASQSPSVARALMQSPTAVSATALGTVLKKREKNRKGLSAILLSVMYCSSFILLLLPFR